MAFVPASPQVTFSAREIDLARDLELRALGFCALGLRALGLRALGSGVGVLLLVVLMGCNAPLPSDSPIVRRPDSLQEASADSTMSAGAKHVWSSAGDEWIATHRTFADSTSSLTVIRSGDTSHVVMPTEFLPWLHDGYLSATRSDTADHHASLSAGYDDGNIVINTTAPWLAVVLLLPVVGVGLLWIRRSRRLRHEQHQADAARRHLAAGREKERQRIARDIHDGPVQDLYALRMHLAAADRSVPFPETDNSPDASLLHASESGLPLDRHLLDVIAELRTISEDLRPPALGPFGLSAALVDCAERFRERYPGLDLQTHIDRLETEAPVLDDETRLVLFRIAQEALNNAARHAHATTVAIRLEIGATVIRLGVTDDGTGFEVPDDVSSLADEGHFGIVGMAERAAAVQGTFSLDSAPGSGTSIEVRVPYN